MSGAIGTVSAGSAVNIALLVDFDHLRREIANHQTETRDAADAAVELLGRLAQRLERDERDRVVVRRAYADWELMGLAGAPARLMGQGIRPIYVLGGRARIGELELALDALELMLSRPDLQRFVLLIGDRDLAPLVRRLREAGRSVMLVGFRDALSGDLVEASGRAAFFPAGPLMGEAGEDAGAPRGGSVAPPGEGPALVEEDLEATRALLKAARARFGSEVPLVSFYKDFMNPELHHLNNEGRKRLVAELERQGELVVQVRADASGVRFAVALVPSEPVRPDGPAPAPPAELPDPADDGTPVPTGSAMLE